MVPLDRSFRSKGADACHPEFLLAAKPYACRLNLGSKCYRICETPRTTIRFLLKTLVVMAGIQVAFLEPCGRKQGGYLCPA